MFPEGRFTRERSRKPELGTRCGRFRVTEVNDYLGAGREGDGKSMPQRFVEGSLPPGCQFPSGDGPAQSFGRNLSFGIQVEKGYLLARRTGQGGRLEEGHEAPVVRQHLDGPEPGRIVGKQGDIAEGVIFPLAGGSEDLYIGIAGVAGEAYGFCQVVDLLVVDKMDPVGIPFLQQNRQAV